LCRRMVQKNMNKNPLSQKKKPLIIERLSPPTEFDTADKFDICFCAPDSVWVQVSDEGLTPRWVEFKSMAEADTFSKELEKIHMSGTTT